MLKVVKTPAELEGRSPKLGYILELTGKNHYVIGQSTFINLTDDDVRALELWVLDLIIERVRKD